MYTLWFYDVFFFDLCIYIESSFQSHHFFQDHLTCFLPGTLALDVFHHALQRFGPRNLAVKSFASKFSSGVSWCFAAIWEVLCNPICWKRIEQLNLPWLTSSLAKGMDGWMDVIRSDRIATFWEESVMSNILKNPLLKFFSPFLLLNV